MGTLLKNKIFAEVNNDKNIVNELIKNYGKITFQGDKRTLWYNGMPYGTAYYKITDGQLSNSSQNHYCDVFGTVRDHQMTKDNINYAVIMGSNNQASVDNSLALGKYNKSTENIDGNTKNYIFSIGNGTGTDIKNRSNLLQVDTEGKLTTSYISYTMLDTSYVSSLGQDATMNVVLNALLTPAEYYAPRTEDFSLSFSGTLSNTNILQGAKIPTVTLTCTWNSRKPKWHQQYIDNYVKTNKSLPSGVSLDDLIYTSYLGTGLENETSYASTTYVRGNNPNTKISIIIPAQTINENTTEIYGGNSTYNLNVSNGETKEFTANEIGKYVICNGGKVNDINYGPSQVTFFKQLVENNVYVHSPSKCFKQGTVTLNIPSLVYWVGVNIYTGIYVGTDDEKDSTNVLNLIKNKSQYKGTSILTGNYNHFSFNMGGIGTIGMTRNDFDNPGKNLNNENYKYIWIAIPTHYFNDGHSDDQNYQHWRIRQISTSSTNTFNTITGDKRNYKFTDDNYTYIIGKTKGNIGILTSNSTKADDGDLLSVADIGIKNNTQFITER